MTNSSPQDNPWGPPPDGQQTGQPSRGGQQGPYQQGDPSQPAKRSTVKVVIAVVLLVIGALATLLALLTTLGYVQVIGDTANPAQATGTLVGSWLVVLVFLVPGVLLLRRPRR